MQQVKVLRKALDLRHVPGILFEQHGARVGHGVDGVSETVDLAGAVARLLVEKLYKIILDGAVVARINIFLDIAEHFHDLCVCAAVQRPFQRADRACDGAVGVRAARRQSAADKGRVIAAAVLGMYHQHHIEQMRFLLGIALVGTDHAEKVFRCGKICLRKVDVERIVVEIVSFDRICIRNDRGEIADQFDRLLQNVLDLRVVRIRVVGVEREHAALQLVHDVAARMPHNHALGKAIGQLSCAVHDPVEVLQLGTRRQIAHEQEICHLFKAEGACASVRFHNVRKLNAAVIELAWDRDALAVLHEIALNAADLRDADKNARAVVVAKAAFDVAAIIRLVDMIRLLDMLRDRVGVLLQNAFAVQRINAPFPCCIVLLLYRAFGREASGFAKYEQTVCPRGF